MSVEDKAMLRTIVRLEEKRQTTPRFLPQANGLRSVIARVCHQECIQVSIHNKWRGQMQERPTQARTSIRFACAPFLLSAIKQRGIDSPDIKFAILVAARG